MNSTSSTWAVAAVGAAILLVSPPAIAGTDAPTAESEAATAVRPVESKEVCMVTDRFFGTEQIPVDAEGKTYYGCCQMCKKTLSQNAEKRSGIDPVSGKSVDKATAVIGARPDGSVEYFENRESLDTFNARSGS